MNAVLDFVSEHGPRLLIGTSVILGAGCLVVWCVRQPLYKQRLSELSMIAAMVWLVLALAPIERGRLTIPYRPSPPPSSVKSNSMTAIKETVSERALKALEPRKTRMETSGILPIAAAPDDTRVGRAPLLLGALPIAPSLEVEFRVPPSSEAIVPSKGPTVFERGLAFGFLAAAVLATAALAAAWLRLRVLVWRSSAADGQLVELWRMLEPPARSRLLVSERDITPMSFGVVTPTVCVPAPLADDCDATVTAVLRHELAHLRHRDAIGRTLFNAALPLFALHPLYWLLRSEAMFAAELRADADAAQATGAQKLRRNTS